ncbi:hypothetical protein [Micromonospora sp. KC213]|uniref:hypothetical protein n=1 Tax=Micromonospora sp. KC213 TaxID=2530378 RepID=UPI0010428BB7|nr:hypothetical protein [Micromonospora sp. KC213]TDC33457.1 hypothetical protein E1166_25650 [Micromonospora sp. KC213]
MANARIRLDHKGIAEILKSAGFAAAMAEKAEEVAAHVHAHHSIRRHGMPVETGPFETDRATQSVTIAHPGGLGVQGKYGVLTQAATAAGLEVTAETERAKMRKRAETRRQRQSETAEQRERRLAVARHRRELARLRQRDRWSL